MLRQEERGRMMQADFDYLRGLADDLCDASHLRTVAEHYDKLVARNRQLETECVFLEPHTDSKKCPTFYDGCNCTVETLVHNIDRAERAEARCDKLVAALGEIRREAAAARAGEDPNHKAYLWNCDAIAKAALAQAKPEGKDE